MDKDISYLKIQKAHSNLLLYGMFSMVMLFAGLTSAYIVHQKSLNHYNLGYCNLQDSTLIMHSDFENEPISSGYFVYKTDQFGKERILLGQVDDVELLSQTDDVELDNSVSNTEIASKNIISLKQIALTVVSFEDELCFATRWDYIKLPSMFYISTIVILLSSLFGWYVIKLCGLNNFKLARTFLLITLLSGVFFAIFQFFGWSELVKTYRYVAGDSNVASSYLYILTGTHLVHLIGGVITLIIIYCKSLFNVYSIDNFHGMKLGIRFWHFLTLLWLYLFVFLIVIN